MVLLSGCISFFCCDCDAKQDTKEQYAAYDPESRESNQIASHVIHLAAFLKYIDHQNDQSSQLDAGKMNAEFPAHQ